MVFYNIITYRRARPHIKQACPHSAVFDDWVTGFSSALLCLTLKVGDYCEASTQLEWTVTCMVIS